MKTVFYVILLIIVLAALAGGIYYLTTQVDFSEFSDKLSNAIDSTVDFVQSAINGASEDIDEMVGN